MKTTANHLTSDGSASSAMPKNTGCTECERYRAALEQIANHPRRDDWAGIHLCAEMAREALGPADETTDTHRGTSQPSAGRRVVRDVASASVHVPTADPDCDGSGHPAGLQSGAPPREAKGGGVPGNAGTAACGSTSEET